MVLLIMIKNRVVGLRKSKLEERVLALELWQTPPPLSKELILEYQSLKYFQVQHLLIV
uniref:Uncharacterized protein n=1 Tax=Meloidogyne enterolobii TaxID=390850 RepID=A0A6V7WNE4_MELEN|nr:unnamed protein product [Meloidogyne enterolobii]